MNAQKTVYRAGMIGAGVNFAGILLSGPLGMGAELLIQPSPPWQSAAVWAQHYHPIQILPFAGGFFMIFGFVMMMAAVYRAGEEEHRTNALVALALTAAFFALIFLNYIVQTTFLPVLARNYNPMFDSAIFIFSLANPNSLAWGIEMWGYALLGVATWLAAPVFNRTRLEKTTAFIMRLNGVISVIGGVLTAVNTAWVMEIPGLISYMAWNTLVLALAVCFYYAMRRRLIDLTE